MENNKLWLVNLGFLVDVDHDNCWRLELSRRSVLLVYLPKNEYGRYTVYHTHSGDYRDWNDRLVSDDFTEVKGFISLHIQRNPKY